jgi:hypothetical protein
MLAHGVEGDTSPRNGSCAVTLGYRAGTDEGVKDGISRLTWVAGVFNDRGLHRVMSEAVYADHESWGETRGRSPAFT